MVLTKKQAAPPVKIFNRYQKIQIIWAFLILFGYLASYVALAAPQMLLEIWLFVFIVGLGAQLILGFPRDPKAMIIQILWFGIILIGGWLTYLEFTTGLVIGVHGMVSGWFFMIAGGMFITSAIYRFNISYLILVGLYGLVGLLLAYGGFRLPAEIVISAIAFFTFFIVDAGMEWSGWRRHIADKAK
jgi:hypothetical protein